jgi:hypothetical protein
VLVRPWIRAQYSPRLLRYSAHVAGPRGLSLPLQNASHHFTLSWCRSVQPDCTCSQWKWCMGSGCNCRHSEAQLEVGSENWLKFGAYVSKCKEKCEKTFENVRRNACYNGLLGVLTLVDNEWAVVCAQRWKEGRTEVKYTSTYVGSYRLKWSVKTFIIDCIVWGYRLKSFVTPRNLHIALNKCAMYHKLPVYMYVVIGG